MWDLKLLIKKDILCDLQELQVENGKINYL